MAWFVRWLFILLTACSLSHSSEGPQNITDPDFPDISFWIPPTLFMEELRSNKVMKAPSTNVGATTKIIVSHPGGGDNVPSHSNKNDVSETDMYLLKAIEKLAFKLDVMEKRLQRTEELLFHVMEGSNIKRQDACPANFTRVARNCYHFSERQYNWKSASSMCKSLGSNLLEIESRDEYMEVVTFLQANNYLRGFEFWTGGLNPGLLWIWANSARPVLPKNNGGGLRPDEKIYGNGRCLRLGLNANKLYEYQGADCGLRQRYICEHEENSTIRALKRIQKELTLKEE